MSIDVNVQNDLVVVTESSEDITVNVSNAAGPAGPGVPVGGSTGQVLKKLSNTNYDTYWALDGGGVPYSGATGDVDLGEYELKAGQIEFDQSPTGTAGVAVMRWNDTDGTLDLGLKGGNVTLQIGQEQVQRVVNKSGVNLLESAYQVVKVTDAQGQRLAVDLAQGNNDLNSADTIGIVTENIDNNQEGFICTSGLVRNINTTGSLQGETWADGDVLYLSPTTAGQITNIKPTAPNHTVVLGYVVYAHANNGKIFVKCDNGYEIGELHDCYLPTPSNNDGIFWSSANSRYQNNTIAGALGYTPVPTTRTLTINGTAYDLSADRSWTVSGTNIYTADGTLTANRSLTLGGYNLSFIGGSFTNRFTSTGRLLLGTTTESTYLLDVNGTARVSGDVLLTRTSGSGSSLRNYFPTATGTDEVGYGVGKSESAGNSAFFAWKNNSGTPYTTIETYGGSGELRLQAISASGTIKIGETSQTVTIKGGNALTLTGKYFSVLDTATGITFKNYNSALTGTENISYGVGKSETSGNTMFYGWANNSGSPYGYIETYGGGSPIALQQSTGNVLIGTTTNSTYKLDVNGTARVSGASSGSTGYSLTVTDTNGTNGATISLNYSGSTAILLKSGSTGARISSTNSKDFFGFNFSNGNVVVGGTESDYSTDKLNILGLNSGTTDGNGITLNDNGGSTGVGAGINFRANSAIRGAIRWTINSGYNNTGLRFFVNNNVGTLTEAFRVTEGQNLLVGSTTNIPSAILAADSTTKGFRPPAMTTTQKNAISSPAVGLMVYCTDATEGLYEYTSSGWINLNGEEANRQTASYTLALTDNGKLVEMNVASANNLTVPLNSSIAFPVGAKIDIAQYGAGQTTVVATGGVTIRSAGGALKLAAQYSGGTLVKIATDEWYLFGDITV